MLTLRGSSSANLEFISILMYGYEDNGFLTRTKCTPDGFRSQNRERNPRTRLYSLRILVNSIPSQLMSRKSISLRVLVYSPELIQSSRYVWVGALEISWSERLEA